MQQCQGLTFSDAFKLIEARLLSDPLCDPIPPLPLSFSAQGRENLKHASSLVGACRANGAFLAAELGNGRVKGVGVLDVPPGAQSAFWLFTLVLQPGQVKETLSSPHSALRVVCVCACCHSGTYAIYMCV